MQQTIPYIYAYQNGIFEIEECVFSKSYALEDINFKIASQEDQNQIFIAFGDFLNSFNNNASLQITIFNRDIDMEEFKEKILMNLKGKRWMNIEKNITICFLRRSQKEEIISEEINI